MGKNASPGSAFILLFAVHLSAAFAQTAPIFTCDDVITFADGTTLRQDSSESRTASPVLCDWDGDGLKDLLTGYFNCEYIYFFKNTGSNEHPEFIRGCETKLIADNRAIFLRYG